jgi:hypothetical protein
VFFDSSLTAGLGKIDESTWVEIRIGVNRLFVMKRGAVWC